MMDQAISSLLRTIPDILRHHVAVRPDSPALIDANGVVLGFGALWRETNDLASQLCAFLPDPSEPAPRIGIVLPNGVDISVTLLAATLCGTAVPFNPAQTRPEFENQFDATGIDILLVKEGSDGAAATAARSVSIPVLTLLNQRRLSPDTGAPQSSQSPQSPRARAPDDIALLLMTSGSTGKPKIVPLSHRNVCRSAFDVSDSLALTQADRCLVMWEQFHIGGLVDLLLAPLAAGSSLVAAGSFDAAAFFRLQSKLGATWFQGVPTTLGALLQHAQSGAIQPPLPDLRFLRSVAAALSETALQDLAGVFKVPVVRTLGMTEAGPLITTTALNLNDDKPKSVGRSAGPEIEILDAQNNPAPAGSIGQVAIRGENVFDGYLDNPEANAASFKNGWFLTGDLGYLDPEGDLFLTGRAKDMINRGGEKISPAEVDEALMAHPEVREAACFAVSHGTLGEDIACAITTRSGTEVELLPIRAFLAQTLAKHKIPARIQVMPELPRTPVGKVDKQSLRGAFEQDQDAPKTESLPQKTMEKLVADIWKQELSLTVLGIDEDFASVDGDSLSAVRVLVALETALGAQVPNEVIEGFSTVREMAAGLERHGLTARMSPKCDGDQAAQKAQSTHFLREDHFFSGSQTEAKNLILNTSGLADLKLKMDYLTTHLAPAEVAQLVDGIKETTPGAALDTTGILTSKRMSWEFRSRLETVRKHLGSRQSANRWQREHLCSGALLYSDPDVGHATKTLIVGFGGNRQRLLMATYRFLLELDPDETDLLLMMDPSQKCFVNGVQGMGDDFGALMRGVSEIYAERGYGRVVGLGTSAGTFAALQSGLLLDFDAVAVVSPAGFARHQDWAEILAPVAAQHDPDRLPIRVVYGRRQRHKDNAETIRHYLPDAEYIRYAQAGKNIIPDAQERGKLKSLLAEWLA